MSIIFHYKYSCFEKGSPIKALKRTRQYRKALWVVLDHRVIVKFTRFQRDESRTMNICLRVLKETNKSRYDTYSVRGVPLCENVFTLKQYLLENCRGEISPASDSTFQIWYYADGKKKFAISSETQLAEALSLEMDSIITLWVDPHKDPSRDSSGKKRKGIVYKRSCICIVFFIVI